MNELDADRALAHCRRDALDAVGAHNSGLKDDGRLAKFAAIGALLGTVGSLAYAFPERSPGGGSPRVAPTIAPGDRAAVFSFGGSF